MHAVAAALPAETLVETPRQPPTPLHFDLSAEHREGIRSAKKTFDATIARTDATGLRTDLIDSKLLKRAKLSPDGTMQVRMQV